MGPRVICTLSTADTEELAAEQTLGQLKRAGAYPRGGAVYSTVGYDIQRLRDALATKICNVPFVGSTSCLGVGAKPNRFPTGKSLAGWWLAGEGFKFGTGIVDKSSMAPRVAGKQLAEAALKNARITSNAARFAIVHPCPGDEEEILAGLGPELPPNVALIGGSAADNDLTGKWKVWTHEGVAENGAVLAVCDWPWQLTTTYFGGAWPTTRHGRVTEASGRTILSIDNVPAAEVYNDWIGGVISDRLDTGGSILADSTLAPLGLARGVDACILVHPEAIIAPQAGIRTFANVNVGDEVLLMQWNKPALVRAAAQLVGQSFRRSSIKKEQVIGALLIYCGGCLLAIQDRAGDMLALFDNELGSPPFTAMFSFGEQGCVVPHRFDHGNLMTGALLLTDER